MKKKQILYILGICIIIISSIIITNYIENKNTKTSQIEATILYKENDKLTIQDNSNIIYTFKLGDNSLDVGDRILIKYTGLLDKSEEIQNTKIVDYKTIKVLAEESSIPSDWQDNGIFKSYYNLAYKKLNTLSLAEKIGQLFLVRYHDESIIKDLKNYKVGGYVFYEKDFRDKTKQEVKTMINNLQTNSKIPLLTAVDEEGGKIVRVSSNANLIDEPFKSSRELYQLGGLEEIKKDTIEKSNFLNSLGLNLNLAPVIDVSTNKNDYMYERSLGENTTITSQYAKTVIETSKNTKVSYTLKHFPGYGNNDDTHTSSVTDKRSYEYIVENDFPPFIAGINAGAEAVLVSHNIVSSIDSINPASLSKQIHNILREDLDFTGIIITDDLAMGAVSNIDNTTIKALLAGNDLIITTDYKETIKSVKEALNNGTISQSLIDKLAFRIISWKYYKGLMQENQK